MKPVVALDIDGVLNIFPPDEPGPRWERHTVTIPALFMPDSPFVPTVPDGMAMTLKLTINPTLHGLWITELRERAEVIWATTWEHAANRFIAPLLGIEPLPVLTTAENPPKFGVELERNATLWKSMALEKRFTGRPLVWIDDSAGRYIENWRAVWDYDEGDYIPNSGPPTLVIAPEECTGITVEQMRAVDAFVAENHLM